MREITLVRAAAGGAFERDGENVCERDRLHVRKTTSDGQRHNK